MSSHFYKYDSPIAVDTTPTVPHPGSIIRTVIEDYEVTISAVAKAISMDRASLSLVLSGKYAVSKDLAYKLGAVFNDDLADLLIEWQHQYDRQETAMKLHEYKAKLTPFPNQ